MGPAAIARQLGVARSSVYRPWTRRRRPDSLRATGEYVVTDEGGSGGRGGPGRRGVVRRGAARDGRGYLGILAAEGRGDAVNKRAFNRDLRAGPLVARTHGAVEWRMQNISKVLQELGRPWVEGYKPAEHVGEVQKARIRTALARAEDREPTADPAELVRRASKARSRRRASGDRAPPEGQRDVGRTLATVLQFKRDPDVIAWVLEAAGGTREGCSQPAPFQRSGGEPFLEVHHVRPLGEGGPDKTDNAVGLCPNWSSTPPPRVGQGRVPHVHHPAV